VNGNPVMIESIKNVLLSWLPKFLLNPLIDFWVRLAIRRKGLVFEKHKAWFDIKSKDGRCIRVSRKHNYYLQDISDSFEYYYSAVKPVDIEGTRTVDYSSEKFHEVVGYELHPIMFPSFAEPITTTEQYLSFANLAHGSVVLDLGADAGLTSILFDQLVWDSGIVVAVEADRNNIRCIKKNFALYEETTSRHIALTEGAMWEHCDGIEFSSEGNMGSSAVPIVGKKRGAVDKIPSYTLSALVAEYSLPPVDFIKCDIEGAESVLFGDAAFFARNKPRIIIEPHIINNVSTTQACIDQLSAYGYQCKEIVQHGVTLPLLECYPE
jgi:FkbM family methyltransferase